MSAENAPNGEDEAERRAPRIVASEDLLKGAREIIIRHGAEDYRLRLTRVGKLILNK
jgi:hemin uptake protein HemP